MCVLDGENFFLTGLKIFVEFAVFGSWNGAFVIDWLPTEVDFEFGADDVHGS